MVRERAKLPMRIYLGSVFSEQALTDNLCGSDKK
jgi:hypothetical protein